MRNRLPPKKRGGRFRFGEKGKEVRTDEKAHYVVDRSADVGADDVVWERGVRGD